MNKSLANEKPIAKTRAKQAATAAHLYHTFLGVIFATPVYSVASSIYLGLIFSIVSEIFSLFIAILLP